MALQRPVVQGLQYPIAGCAHTHCIDLLRTENDVELYVDGKLLEIGVAGASHHQVIHAMHKEIDMDCSEEAECDELVLLSDEEADLQGEQHDGEKVYIIRKEVITN